MLEEIWVSTAGWKHILGSRRELVIESKVGRPDGVGSHAGMPRDYCEGPAAGAELDGFQALLFLIDFCLLSNTDDAVA